MTQTIICFDNILNDDAVTVTASSTKDGYYVENLYDFLSYDRWESDEMTVPTITVSGTDLTADYFSIVYHNVGGVVCNVYIDSVLTDTFTPEDGAPILRLLVDEPGDTPLTFDEFQIEFETLEDVRVSLLYVGELLLTERPCKYIGHNPINLSKKTKVSPVNAMNGQTLGGRVLYTGASNTYEIENLSPDWVRGDDFQAFMDHVETVRPYLIAWRQVDYPLEIGFGWTYEPLKPQNQRTNGMMNVNWAFEAVVDSNIEQIGDYEVS